MIVRYVVGEAFWTSCHFPMERADKFYRTLFLSLERTRTQSSCKATPRCAWQSGEGWRGIKPPHADSALEPCSLSFWEGPPLWAPRKCVSVQLNHIYKEPSVCITVLSVEGEMYKERNRLARNGTGTGRSLCGQGACQEEGKEEVQSLCDLRQKRLTRWHGCRQRLGLSLSERLLGPGVG